MRAMRLTRCALVVTALCAGWSGVAWAQKVETGVKVGVDISGLPNGGELIDQIVGQPSRETTSRIGLIGGGYARFPISNNVGFQPEMLFVMKGVKLDEADGGSVSVRINYLEFPLLARYQTSLSSAITGFVVAGPSFGLKLNSSAKLDSTAGSTDVDVSQGLRSLDLGVAVGGGIVWNGYILEARYTGGLTDIADASFPHPDSLRNRAFAVTIGMKLPR
jgi:hypothetical protein